MATSSRSRKVILIFTSSQCGPCKAFKAQYLPGIRNEISVMSGVELQEIEIRPGNVSLPNDINSNIKKYLQYTPIIIMFNSRDYYDTKNRDIDSNSISVFGATIENLPDNKVKIKYGQNPPTVENVISWARENAIKTNKSTRINQRNDRKQKRDSNKSTSRTKPSPEPPIEPPPQYVPTTGDMSVDEFKLVAYDSGSESFE
jgi:hypothetical protein